MVAFRGAQVSLTSRGAAAEESPTHKMPPQPIAASASRSKTSTVIFGAPRPLVSSACAVVTAAAKSGGVRSPGGMFTQSRQAATALATIWACSKASVAADCRAIELSTTTSLGPDALASADLN